MNWANFLHIYQPFDQNKNILDAVVTQSYRPVLQGIKNRPHAKLTLNINGSLLELFDKYGHRDLIDIIREIAGRGQVELTGSAKYHTFLPFLDESEIERQIKINSETNKFYLGEAWKPLGFFPPEMAFDKKIVPILESLGFSWLVIDEIACGGQPGNVDYNSLYKISNSNLRVFFRERRLSNLIMGAVVRSADSLKESMKDDLNSDRYVITAMDGETFGHHRPGLEKMLFEILDNTDFNLVRISDLENSYQKVTEIIPTNSTWASSAADIEKGIQFLSWSDPSNEIHIKQKEFTDLALNEVRNISEDHEAYLGLRQRMDSALASDQFFWASAKPWWSVEMIENSAFGLLEIVRQVPNVSMETLDRSRTLYESIVSTAFAWQRTGKIHDMMSSQDSMTRIPFIDRTIGRGGQEEGVYHAFVDMMKGLEKEAAQNGEYEKAILWRDAVFKLENKLDIYDTVNSIDLLRIEIPNQKVEETIEKYKDKYRSIRGGQPEQRGN